MKTSDFSKVPDDAIVLPNDNISYLAVWQTEDRVKLQLRFDNFTVALDKKIIPHLVDALIELQNRGE
jgi:hypothetical protein